ncbi:hypothetical protein PanWU01x14_020570 [Parasponia andersonii]|uniref:Uncharacterized protein n=1 Tax=Parasponia andersonii TaxID=3476 RepID=A0A2P5DYN5_PARAD|nr:hypothetical protein PanWU01x14_020570 [Parasponia andersonii]
MGKKGVLTSFAVQPLANISTDIHQREFIVGSDIILDLHQDNGHPVNSQNGRLCSKERKEIT